jgi:signal transduction histidine kinase
MRRSLAEAVVIAGTAVVGVGGVVAEYRSGDGAFPPLAGAIALSVAAILLLLLRHRAAVLTGVAIAVLCLAYRLAGYPGLAVAAPLYPACYSVVAQGSSRRSLVAGSALAATVPAIALVPPWPPAGVNVNALVGVVTLLAATLAVAEAQRVWTFVAEQRLQRVREESDGRVMAERLTIARELHDVVAHTITLISVQAAAGLDALPARPEQAESALRTIRGAAKDAMVELRSTLRVLRDGPATDGPAPQPRLGQVAQLVEAANSSGVAVSLVSSDAPPDLPIGVELAAYRIVQEALTNVIRHAHATTATVRIDHQPDTLLVTVADNGTAQVDGHHSGHGLIGMRERVRAVGGAFEAGPAPGGGYAVTARLSLGGPA